MKQFGKNQNSGRGMIFYATYPPNKCISVWFTSEWKNHPTQKNVYQILIESNMGLLSKMLSFFYIPTSLDNREYLLHSDDEIPPSRGAFSIDLLVKIFWFYSWEWTIWARIREQDDFVGEFPFRSVVFVSIFQAIVCHGSNNNIIGSLDWGDPSFLVLRSIVFLALFCY